MSKQNKQPLLQRPAVVGGPGQPFCPSSSVWCWAFVLLVLLNPRCRRGRHESYAGHRLFQHGQARQGAVPGGTPDDVRPVRRLCVQDGPVQHWCVRPVHDGRFLLAAVRHSIPAAVVRLPAGGRCRRCDLGCFPGLFKAYFNVNEVITAIMFNWIGMYLVNLLLANMPNMLASGWGRV